MPLSCRDIIMAVGDDEDTVDEDDDDDGRSSGRWLALCVAKEG